MTEVQTVILNDEQALLNNNDETTPLVQTGSYDFDGGHEDPQDDVEEGEETAAAPKDHYNLVYLVFVLVGITTLLPWNFFISLNNFWDYKFRNVSQIATTATTAGNGTVLPPTQLQKDFTSYLAISSTVPNAIFVIINAGYGQRFSLSKRLTYSLSMMIVMFTAITALAFIDTDAWQKTFLVILLTLVVIVNINSAIFQGGSFGMAGKFPEKYMSAQMIGQAIGGVFPALVDIFIVALQVKEEDVGSACFTIATIVLLACLFSLRWSFQTDFFKHYYFHRQQNSDEPVIEKPPLLQVIRRCWVYLLSIFVTFTVTLTIFPSVAVLVQSETFNSDSKWAIDYFTPVCVFLLFNVGDLAGRSLASWIKLPGRSTIGKTLVLISSISRIGFIPLFVNCNIVTENRSVSSLFASDADFIAFMALFALSNGYIGNLCMLNGPKSTCDKEMQEAIALLLIAGLVCGTGVGSFLSYPLVTVL